MAALLQIKRRNKDFIIFNLLFVSNDGLLCAGGVLAQTPA